MLQWLFSRLIIRGRIYEDFSAALLGWMKHGARRSEHWQYPLPAAQFISWQALEGSSVEWDEMAFCVSSPPCHPSSPPLPVFRCMPAHINQRCVAGTERGCHTTGLHSNSWIGRKRCKHESCFPLDGWHFEFMWILIRWCSDARHYLHFKTWLLLECNLFFLYYNHKLLDSATQAP